MPADGATLADGGVGADENVSLDGGPRPDGDRADDSGLGAESDRSRELDRARDLGTLDMEVARDGHVGNLLEFPALGLPEGPRAPDVRPVAPGEPAPEGLSLGEEAREEVPGEVVLPTMGDVVKDLRVTDVHAHAREVREDLPRPGLFLEPLDVVVHVHLGDAELARVVDGDEPDGDDALPEGMGPVELEEVHVGDVVSADDEEPAPLEVPLGVLHRACGPELGLFPDVPDVRPEEGAVTESLLDDLPQVPQGEDHLGEPQIGKVGDQVGDGRDIDNGNAGFRPLEGEGTEPGPLAPAHDADLHRGVSVQEVIKGAWWNLPFGASGDPGREADAIRAGGGTGGSRPREA